MICEPCKDKSHESCKAGSWCDCQHRPPAGEGREGEPSMAVGDLRSPTAQKIGVPGIASGEAVGDIGGSGDSQNSHVSYGSAIHGRQ